MDRAITSLTIKGFKSIRSLEDFKLGPLNLLIGANGAGKSNFVSFFSLLRSLVEQELQLNLAQHGGADAHLFLGPKITKEIVAQLYFGRNGYEFTLVPTSDNKLVFGNEVAYFDGDFGESRKHLGKGHDETRLGEAAANPRGHVPSYVHRDLSSWIVYHFHDTSETAGVRRFGTTRDHEHLRRDACNLAAFLTHLQESQTTEYNLIRDTVRLVVPFFNDFKLRPQPNGCDTMVQLEWTQKGSDYPFHPSQLSDGTLRFMCLATALLQPSPPATMLFDEPELGLHPYALGVLAGLLRQASERTQVIVSTQSAPLLDHFDVDQIIVVDRKDGASEFRRLEPEKLADWLNDYSLGELWQKNVFEGGPANE